MLTKGGGHGWHPMSSDDRAQRNESPWKRKPTAIAIPSNDPDQTNLPSHNSHMSSTAMSKSDPYNPFSGRTANNLGPRTRNKAPVAVGNRTASSTITAPPPRPRKKKRTEEARSKPPLAPEEVTEIDAVEVDSSSDELNGFKSTTHRTKKHDKPQLDVQNGDAVHAFDVDLDSPPSNAVASTSRIHDDGPATITLQQRLKMSPPLVGSSSPIEQFEDEQKPSTTRVTELKKMFEGGDDQPHEGRGKPHKNRGKPLEDRDKLDENRDKPASLFVDFNQVPSLKGNMRGKKPMDPVATSSTRFQKGRRSAASRPSGYSMPMKACYFDTRFISDGSDIGHMQLAWNPCGSDYTVSYELSGEKVQYSVNVAEAAGVEYTEQRTASDAYDGMPIVNILMHRGVHIDAIRNPDPNSVPVKSRVHAITIKLDARDKNWNNGMYNQFIQWIRGNHIQVNLSRNAKQIWEMAERAWSQDSDSEVVLPQVAEPVSRSSLGPVTSDTRSQTDVPQEKSDIQAVDDPTPAPRRSRRILTVKKPIIAVDPDEVILVYPQGVPGAINITNADVSRLQPGEFLNDTLIEFGLKLWHTELGTSNPELAKQIHVFSSFFYKKLNKKNFEEGYESVRKWTSKINLFEKKYIIIPINEHLHWYLAIIFMPEHILLPPPPPLVKQTAASRTRSRTSLAVKTVAEIEVPTDSPSPLTPTSDAEEKSEFTKHINQFSCTVSVTEANTSNAMDISPDNSASLNATQLVDEFAMDVDKSEEMAVQEQLRLSSPTVSELGAGRAQSSGDRPATAYMDVETEQADKQAEAVPSRYFAKEPEATVTTTSITEANPSEQIQEEDFDQQEEEDIQEPGDLNSSQRTYIFTLDSLGTRHPLAIKQLNRYLKMEAQDKRNISSDNTSNALGKPVPVPTQPNFCDCGVYLLHFAQTFMADPAKYFKIVNENKKPPPIGERKEIWEDYKVGTMREQLEDRIKDLSREWKQARAAKDGAKKDQTDTVQESDSSDIEYVDLAPATTVQGKGKTGKGGTKKPKAARLRG